MNSLRYISTIYCFSFFIFHIRYAYMYLTWHTFFNLLHKYSKASRVDVKSFLIYRFKNNVPLFIYSKFIPEWIYVSRSNGVRRWDGQSSQISCRETIAGREIETVSAPRHDRPFFRVWATPVRKAVTAPGVIYAFPDLHWLRGPRHVAAKANTASYQPPSLVSHLPPRQGGRLQVVGHPLAQASINSRWLILLRY